MAYTLIDDSTPTRGGFTLLPDEPKKTDETTFVERFARGLMDPIQGGAQLLTKILPDSVVQAGNRANNWLADKTGLVAKLPEGGVDQQTRDMEREYQARRGDAGFDGARVLGNILNPANLAVASRIPQAASLAGKLGMGAVGGAASSLTAPVESGDYASEKAKQLASGAAFGAAVPAITGAIGRVVSPNAASNPQLALLKQEGVTPTIGQSLGGRWNVLEEKLSSVPIVGDAVSNARGRVLEQFNNAAINRATAPIGARVTGVGQAAVKDAGDAISDAYTAGKNALGTFRLDPQGITELRTIGGMAQSLPDKERKMFESVWNTIKTDISPNGHIAADSFKRIDSKLEKEASRFGKSTDAYQQQLGDALTELRNTLMGNATRANPRAAEMLKNADEAWANLVRVEGAAKAGMNSGGVFTPGQLNIAVRQADDSVRGRGVSRGVSLMQDLSGAGQQVLGNKVPNSFTTDRALIAGGIGGLYNPMLLAAPVLGAAAYSKPLQGLLSAAVSSRPDGADAVRRALQKASPSLIPAGAQIGLGLLDY